MFITILSQVAVIAMGNCPGAYIDYDFYRKKYRDDTYIPVRVQVNARRELRKCHKAGIKVPYTVAEYNNRSSETFTQDQVLTRPYYRNPVEW